MVQTRPSDLSTDIIVLVPEGRLDAQAAPSVDRQLSTLERQEQTQVIVDCSRVRYISSSGLRVLLVHSRSQKKAGGDLKLCCLTDKVADVLRITGLNSVLALYDSEEDAARAFLVAASESVAACAQGMAPDTAT
jgi:anti-anti-sigma factor